MEPFVKPPGLWPSLEFRDKTAELSQDIEVVIYRGMSADSTRLTMEEAIQLRNWLDQIIARQTTAEVR